MTTLCVLECLWDRCLILPLCTHFRTEHLLPDGHLQGAWAILSFYIPALRQAFRQWWKHEFAKASDLLPTFGPL